MDFKTRICELLMAPTGLEFEKIFSLIEIPPKNVDADFAFPCFILSKIKKKNPQLIASEIAKNLTEAKVFNGNITASGSYINFKYAISTKAKIILSNIAEDAQAFAKQSFKNLKQERIVIEYPSPNTNKPLHLGHVRNMLIGQFLTKLNKFAGNQTFVVNLYNDRGVHICKSMYAYQKWGNNSTPESEDLKSDHFVGKYYVKYDIELQKSKETKDTAVNMEEAVQEMLRKWEANDTEIRELWKKMNNWAFQGYNQTFKEYGIQFDKIYYESEIYDKGKEIVLAGIEKGIFTKCETGETRIFFKDFAKKGLPESKVLLRSDQTTLYITQDLYLAYLKQIDFNYDRSLYVIGNEQNMQMRTVFEILESLKQHNILGFKGNNVHISYGMIYLPSGKMKSREGKVVDADDIIADMIDLARQKIKERYSDLSQDEIENRTRKIGHAALRFFILKYDMTADFTFDPEKSIEFEGETGPYIQYTYARTASIFRKAEKNLNDKFSLEHPNWGIFKEPSEEKLISKLAEFPQVIFEAVDKYKIHYIPKYLLELAQSYNEFYRDCPVLNTDNEQLKEHRLYLIKCFADIIKIGLNLMNIETLDMM